MFPFEMPQVYTERLHCNQLIVMFAPLKEKGSRMNNSNQPQVRSGSLPTNTPNVQPRNVQQRTVQQRTAAPETEFDESEQDLAAASALVPAPEKKPRKKHAPRKKLTLNDGAELSSAELVTLGRITIKASQAGVTPAKYIDNLKKARGSEEIDVWDKVTANTPEATHEDE